MFERTSLAFTAEMQPACPIIFLSFALETTENVLAEKKQKKKKTEFETIGRGTRLVVSLDVFSDILCLPPIHPGYIRFFDEYTYTWHLYFSINRPRIVSSASMWVVNLSHTCLIVLRCFLCYREVHNIAICSSTVRCVYSIYTLHAL